MKEIQYDDEYMNLKNKSNMHMWLMTISTGLLNLYAGVLIINSGGYAIESMVLFSHLAVSILLSCCLFLYNPTIDRLKKALWIPCIGLPIFMVLMNVGRMTFWMCLTHFSVVIALIVSLYWALHAYQHLRVDVKAMACIVGGWMIWGDVFVLESMIGLYDAIAPFTLMYHFFLIQEGFLHASTIVYLSILMVISWGLYRHD